MRRIAFILTVTLLLGAILLPTVPARAGGDGGVTLGELREVLTQTEKLFSHWDNFCVIILDSWIVEWKNYILHARKLITVGRGNNGDQLLNVVRGARQKIERAHNVLEDGGYCRPFLEDGDGDHGSGDPSTIRDGVTFLRDNLLDTIHPQKAFLINQILDNLDQSFDAVLDRLADELDSLEKVDEVLGGLEEALDACGETQTDSMKIETVLPQLEPKGPCSLGELRDFKIQFGQAFVFTKEIVWWKKWLVQWKKWIWKWFKELETLLRSSSFNWTSALIVEQQARVYDLSGRLVLDHASSASLAMNHLPNGVYFYIRGNSDQKLVVAR